MRCELSYLSTACNRTPNICDWGKNGLICYGACNSVIICDPKHKGTAKNLKILTSHTNRVNAVKWIRTNDSSNETELASASSDNTAIIWTLFENEYKCVALKGHTDGVNIIECIYGDNSKHSLTVATASIDSTVRIWKRDSFGGEVVNVQVFDFNRGLSLALSLTFLPGTDIILLACARDNSKVDLYVEFREGDNQIFRVVHTLRGHENWVRGLDFTINDNGIVYLASSAQDNYIRIWCISAAPEEEEEKTLVEMLMEHKMHAMESHFSIPSTEETKRFSVHLESVLCGHEGWVYEVNWSPLKFNPDGSFSQPMSLLSCSLDKTMLIWTLNKNTGLWMETMRVGEVGGNTLGFYGSKFSPDGQSIIGHGYLGSFHIWNFRPETNMWEPGVTFGGHFEEVVDLSWEPQGEFLLSISTDQTTRIHAPWVKKDKEEVLVSWHELARPQVHGYDMSCLAVLSRYKFVSGAEEKIVRAFKAPSNFVSNFRHICCIDFDPEGENILNSAGGGPRGASVPSLGLSNKAVYETSNEAENQCDEKSSYPEDSYFHELNLTAPPKEEDLLQNTLWPEIQKLYGHGYELFSLAASNSGKIVASACKATTPEHAAVILWDSTTWHQLQKLSSHTLTVTQVMFSPDDEKILTVSRDRRWSIFERDQSGAYHLSATTDKKNGKHTRIIWCCAWSHDSLYFSTGSRDGKLVIWWKNPTKRDVNTSLRMYEAAGAALELKNESVTAVAFAPVLVENSYLLSVGLETGIILFYSWNLQKGWEKRVELNKSLGHHLTVKRIFFRPRLGMAGGENRTGKGEEKVLQVASCSSDHSVKVHNLYFD